MRTAGRPVIVSLGLDTEEARMGSAEEQAALWGTNADDWAALTEPTSMPIYDAVCDALDVGPGVELLDAACGAGLGLVVAAKRGATVAGFDATPEMLEVARDRVPDADIRHADLEAVPWPDEHFDAVMSCNGVQYASDPSAALAELRRVVRPGQPVAVVTWGDPQRCDAAQLLGALGALMPPRPPGAGGPFALSEPGKLESLLEAAGLEPSAAGEVDTPFVWADVETAWRANCAAGPNVMVINHAGVESVRQAFDQAMTPFIAADGTVRLDNVFRYAVGRR
jgi:SAM-dependent methyltransferase